MGVRDTIFAAMTGLAGADVSGKADGSVRGMLLSIGGRARTKSGIDLTAAASKLGVSRRTVERWVKAEATGAGQHPSAKNAKKLATMSRQAATTKAGRKSAIAQSPGAQAAAARGARISITGFQGPIAAGKEYLRHRATQLTLDPDEAKAMQNAWLSGGEKGFNAWATSYWGEAYLDDWEFGSVEGLEIEHLSGGQWR